MSRLKRWALFISIALVAGIIGFLYFGYYKVIAPNVYLDTDTQVFYLKSGSTLNSLVADLSEEGIIRHAETFAWVAEKKNLANNIYPGKYVVTNGLNNSELVDLFRSASMEEIDMTFPALRNVSILCGIAGRKLELDSAKMNDLLANSHYVAENFGLSRTTIMSMFIPNTYRMSWATSEEAFLKRMASEYKKFWNDKRKALASRIGLSQSQVSTMASIVLKETSMSDEQPVVAGVYMNRVNRGMLLQADPTLIFALNDYSIKRVLNVHKQIDSPYNTYKHVGLPPGPICIPSIKAMDAVLNYKRHKYLYFCAKEDFSGYHNFASTYSQHLSNARRYQSALNKRKIYK